MNKIGWCSETWNPVRGCLNEGECKKDCYARRMNKRTYMSIATKEVDYCIRYGKTHWSGTEFGESILDRIMNFKPTWIESNFVKKFPKKPQRIFIGSMSEVWFWKPEWMEEVLNRIKEYPQHTFQFLTKFPEVYNRYIFPQNCWLGVTVTRQKDLEKLIMNESVMLKFDTIANKIFLSIEPILEPIRLYPTGFDWVIVGAMTGPGSKKHQPYSKWIDNVSRYCKRNHIPLFMKDSIKLYWHGKLATEFPGGGE